jgi:hypothetical protein
MLNPFGPIPDLAAMLHEGSCSGGHDRAVRPADCLAARSAAEALRSLLVEAGLAVAPLYAVQWIQRTFSDLTDERASESAPATRSASKTRPANRSGSGSTSVMGRRPSASAPTGGHGPSSAWPT